ncbi:MAG TPA: carboxypeptidase regulatory-like domain-containing protein [Syntrophaceae bacterium]|nr:carboxypeptidase regulatory-like domain-containing protein [Syntrophaceae bacterium]
MAESKMKYTVKLLLDLREIKEDPGLEKELYKEEKPIKVAAVRGGKILAAVEIEIRNIKDVSKIPVTIEFDYPTEEPPGAYIIIAPNLPEREFLGIEAKKIWVSPRKFKDNTADLTKERILIPKYLFRWWLILCHTYTITGRVVKRVWKDHVPCDEPVPGAKVEAYDVDCWWFWWKKDLVGSATTNPDGTFEIKFRWCCLLWYPLLKPRWVIDPDLLKHITKAVKPYVGPIPPEVLKSPIDFEKFLGGTQKIAPHVGAINIGEFPGGEKATPSFPLPPPKGLELAREELIAPVSPITDLISKIRPILSPLRCWPFWPKDCSPDIIFKVTQECEGEENIIHDEGPFQTRWNIPISLNVSLFANEKACSIPICEEPPPGDCLKFSWVNCVSVEHIGTSPGPPDLRGYAYPLAQDRPFAETIRVKGLFGAGSDVDYFKVQYSYNGGAFNDMPKDKLVGFGRSYWAPSSKLTSINTAKMESCAFYSTRSGWGNCL